MDAPRCIVCNIKHWSRQACPAMSREARLEHARDILRVAEGVTKPVTKPTPPRDETAVTIPPQNVTKPPPVTKPATTFVTPDHGRGQAPAAPPKGGRPRLGEQPMTAAERMRRHRQRQQKSS